jgi:2-polyprenyl-3-methyl-5-hydroxy-6-metoxy-1,4-benzoquinol methylase
MVKVSDHYDAVAEGYHQHYDRERLMELDVYPANYFRQKIMLATLLGRGVKRVLDVGAGDGSPMSSLIRAGVECWGLDLSENMVAKCRERLKSLGQPEERVQWGDITDPATYIDVMRGGTFDGLMAMGVMPHVENDVQILKNMAACLRPGGVAFIEFRNKLFSMFTLNRYTHEFIMDELLPDMESAYKEKVSKALADRLAMDQPPKRDTVEGGGPGYDTILSKFHNPLTVGDDFAQAGFQDLSFHWYHYHPAPPMLENLDPKAFRKQAMAMEQEPSGWRGMFLCSAFVVEAVRA